MVSPFPLHEWPLATIMVSLLNPESQEDDEEQKAYNAANAIVIKKKMIEIGKGALCPVCDGYGHNERTFPTGCPSKHKV